MLDVLEELKDLSEVLQSRDISLPTANKLIKRQVDVFKGRKDSSGHYLALITTAVKEMQFCGIHQQGQREDHKFFIILSIADRQHE